MQPFGPPIEPMLAKLTSKLPSEGGYLFEPKWDGFRALVFRDGDEVYLQSRMKKPLARYFPELLEPLAEQLPARAILDGEIVLRQGDRLDFEALQLRLHPAKSRIEELAAATPTAFVAFDLLAEGDEDLRNVPMVERRARLEALFASRHPSIYLTPATTDIEVARGWFARFEGAGLDGIIAKPLDLIYQPKKRAMLKIKHRHDVDCVVAGFRWHKNGPGTLVGSLLLGLYDEGRLEHVGVSASFSATQRRSLAEELSPLREDALEGHPWAEWASFEDDAHRKPGAHSRWSQGKDLTWVPLRVERVAEVSYDHLEGRRFRHAATFHRWRLDRSPESCTYEQLAMPPPAELATFFAHGKLD